jgi:hypothetical protein
MLDLRCTCLRCPWPSTPMGLNNIARDEELDILNPLRHLMEQHEDNDIDRSTLLLSVLPPQLPSVQNEVHQLSFVNHSDPSQPPVTIALSVNASPGCGGIAWPAGQVSSRIPLMNIELLYLSRCYPTTLSIKARPMSKVKPSSNWVAELALSD